MGESFDPYLKWLGIPPKHQPPNHYRLLGIEVFEADPDVIANAADARMTHLKTFSSGKHSELSQQILNEISAARICLLNAQDKAEYDAELKIKLRPKAAPPVRKPAKAAVPVVDTDVTAPVPFIATDASPSMIGKLRKTSAMDQPWVKPAVIGALVGVVAFLLVVAIYSLQGSESSPPGDPLTQLPEQAHVPEASPPAVGRNETAQSPGASEQSSGQATSGQRRTDAEPAAATGGSRVGSSSSGASAGSGTRTSPSAKGGTTSGPASASKSGSGESSTTSSPAAESPSAKPAPTESPSAKPATTESPSAKPAAAGQPGSAPEPTPTEKPAEPAGPPPAQVAGKRPAPDEAAWHKAEQEVRTIYKEDFDKVKTPEDKLAFASRLGKEAASTQDAVARFALAHLAAGMAADAGNLPLSLTIIEGMEKEYQFKGLTLKADVLAKTAKEAARDRTAMVANQQVMTAARGLLAEALHAADIETADAILNAAAPSSRVLKDRALVAEMTKGKKEVERLLKRKEAVKKAVEEVKTDPANAAANQTIGEWFCFVAGQWDKGVPLLAKASDEKLAAAAQQEAANPADPDGQIALADRWWGIADGYEGTEKERIRERATHWYQKASPQLSGIARTRVEKRLNDLGIILTPYALRFAQGHVAVPNSGYPGNSPITLEAIVRPTFASIPPSLASGNSSAIPGTIIGNGNEAGLRLSEVLYSSSHAYWYFIFHCKTPSSSTPGKLVDSYIVVDNATVAARKWAHVAGVCDGKEIRIYLDGRMTQSEKIPGPHVVSPMPFVIGASPHKSSSGSFSMEDYFRGMIRAIRVSNTARYTGQFDPPAQLTADPDTKLLYVFTEGAGDVLKDRSGSGLDGRITGATWVKVDEETPEKPTVVQASGDKPDKPAAAASGAAAPAASSATAAPAAPSAAAAPAAPGSTTAPAAANGTTTPAAPSATAPATPAPPVTPPAPSTTTAPAASNGAAKEPEKSTPAATPAK